MTSLFHLLTLAAAATSEGAAEAPPTWSQQHPVLTLLPFIGFMLLLWYLLLGRPQQRQTRERETMLEAVRKGDRVKSIGGIHGSVARVDKEKQVVTVQVAKGVEIDFDKAAISTVTRSKGQPSP